jgi:LPXTG-motif cell wall-anchored protein
MRMVKSLLTVIAGFVLLFQAGGTVAWADDKGNNGDIKIHDASTAQADNRNEPHVCTFYIDGFNFDKSSSGMWRIERWSPTGSGQVAQDHWSADASGNWRSNTLSLPDGHYKAFAKQLSPMTSGGEKQKVFWVECAPKQQPAAPGNNQGGGNNGNNGQPQQPAAPTNSQSKAGGSKSGTGSKSKAKGSASGTKSQSKHAQQPAAQQPETQKPEAQQPNQVVGGVITPPMNNEQAAAPQLPQVQASRAVAGVQNLPSTSTSTDAPAAVLGVLLIGTGAYLLRRPQRRMR